MGDEGGIWDDFIGGEEVTEGGVSIRSEQILHFDWTLIVYLHIWINNHIIFNIISCTTSSNAYTGSVIKSPPSSTPLSSRSSRLRPLSQHLLNTTIVTTWLKSSISSRILTCPSLRKYKLTTLSRPSVTHQPKWTSTFWLTLNVRNLLYTTGSKICTRLSHR